MFWWNFNFTHVLFQFDFKVSSHGFVKTWKQSNTLAVLKDVRILFSARDVRKYERCPLQLLLRLRLFYEMVSFLNRPSANHTICNRSRCHPINDFPRAFRDPTFDPRKKAGNWNSWNTFHLSSDKMQSPDVGHHGPFPPSEKGNISAFVAATRRCRSFVYARNIERWNNQFLNTFYCTERAERKVKHGWNNAFLLRRSFPGSEDSATLLGWSGPATSPVGFTSVHLLFTPRYSKERANSFDSWRLRNFFNDLAAAEIITT